MRNGETTEQISSRNRQEDLNSREILWQSETAGIAVRIPKKPGTRLAEGIHAVVTSQENEETPWTKQDLREVLRKEYFALPIAKVLAEGKFTEEFWANIHLDKYGVSIFGKNPQSEKAWAKPVVKSEYEQENLPQDQEAKLKDTFSRYMPLWEKQLENISLFTNGVNGYAPDSKEFEQEVSSASAADEDILWVNNKFILVNIKKPHLRGVHLVVHPKKSYWDNIGKFQRGWQTQVVPGEPTDEYIRGFLEASAILIAAERLLIEEGQLGYNPEIHFSGNWAKGLLPRELGGMLNMEGATSQEVLTRKNEKRLHRPGKKDEEGNITDFGTSLHGHLYATDNPDNAVKLPIRPITEVPQEWEGIQPMSQEKVDKAKSIIQEKLTPFLSQYAQGQLSLAA